MSGADSRSGGGDGKGTGAASLAENLGHVVHGRKAPAKELQTPLLQPLLKRRVRQAPGGPGSHACGLTPPQEPTHREGVPAGKPPGLLGRWCRHRPWALTALIAAVEPSVVCPGLSAPNRLCSPRAEHIHPFLCSGALQPQDRVRSPSLGGIKEAKEGFLHWRNLQPPFPP